MYIPKKLKLNQYRVCQIPSAREIVGRFGPCPGKNFSGDSETPRNLSKTDAAAMVDYLDARNRKQEEINSLYEQNKDDLPR